MGCVEVGHHQRRLHSVGHEHRVALSADIERSDRQALVGRAEPADLDELGEGPIGDSSPPADLTRAEPLPFDRELVAAAAAPLGDDAVAHSSRPAHEHLCCPCCCLGDERLALYGVLALIGVQHHPEMDPSERADASQRPQCVLEHHERATGPPHTLAVEPFGVAAESLTQRGICRWHVEVREQQDAAVEASCRLPHVGLGLVGEVGDWSQSDIGEGAPCPLSRPGEAQRVVGPARELYPLLQGTLHLVATLGDELESALGRIDCPCIHRRGLRRSEVASARHLDETVDECREVQPDMCGAHEVRPVLAETGQAVDLEDVDVVVRVHPHVDACAVEKAEHRERTHCYPLSLV